MGHTARRESFWLEKTVHNFVAPRKQLDDRKIAFALLSPVRLVLRSFFVPNSPPAQPIGGTRFLGESYYNFVAPMCALVLRDFYSLNLSLAGPIWGLDFNVKVVIALFLLPMRFASFFIVNQLTPPCSCDKIIMS